MVAELMHKHILVCVCFVLFVCAYVGVLPTALGVIEPITRVCFLSMPVCFIYSTIYQVLVRLD